MMGKTIKVLIENPAKESIFSLQGRYYGQAPEIDGKVLIRKGKTPVGKFCEIKIVDALEYDLVGEISGSPDLRIYKNILQFSRESENI